MFTVEYLVTDQRPQVHMARMRPYANASLDMTEELKEGIARIKGEGDLLMADMINVGQLGDGSYSRLVEWIGLQREPSREPVENFFHDTPQFHLGQVRKMGLSCAMNKELQVWHGMRV